MYLYNETIGIDQSIEAEWLQWMKEYYLPKAMETKLFVNSRIYKVLHDQDDGNISYSVQYFTTSIDNIQQYLEVFGPRLIEEHRIKFKDKHVAFRTLLQEA